MIFDGGQISRRGFLAASALAGTAVLARSRDVDAIRLPIPLAQALEEALPTIGRLTYAQAHVTDAIGLTAALGMVEFMARGRRLDKVAALGDVEFATVPKNIMATLYMDRGLRCMVTSAAPVADRLAFFRGEKGSAIVMPKKVRLLDAEDGQLFEPPLQNVPFAAESVALPHVLDSLRSKTAKLVSV